MIVRQRRTGSTDVAAMLAYYTPGMDSLTKRKNATDVWMRIVHRIDMPQNAPMKRGLKREPEAREAYQAIHGPTHRPVPYDQPFIVRHPSIEWATCSPDDLKDTAGVLEMKTSSVWDLKNWGAPMTDNFPEIYHPQCAWLLACTGLEFVHVWASFGRDGKDENKQPIFPIQERRLYIYKRDLEFERMLIDCAARFQREHIETRIPPSLKPVHNRRKLKKLLKEENAHV